MENKELKSSEEWSKKYSEVAQIIDADGWDRRNFDESWNELITEDEFNRRLCNSTCLWKNLRV